MTRCLCYKRDWQVCNNFATPTNVSPRNEKYENAPMEFSVCIGKWRRVIRFTNNNTSMQLNIDLESSTYLDVDSTPHCHVWTHFDPRGIIFLGSCAVAL